jgi:uncharacterized protein YcbX
LTSSPIVVSGLAITPIKGTRLQAVDRVELDLDGARGNRRFFVIDERDRMLNGKQLGDLSAVVAQEIDGTMRLTFPGGDAVEGRVEVGPPVTTAFFSRTVEGRLVVGPWSEALSRYLDQQLRLVQAIGSVDRGRRGAASLISRASLARLADVAGKSEVDGRRFRMLIEVDGVLAHGEDRWVGRTVQIGNAVVRWVGHAGRCLVTTRHPETGSVDLPTLDLLRQYRGDAETTEPLAFGIFGEVVRAGAVRLWDPVAFPHS